jgi:predicted dehydrogenase
MSLVEAQELLRVGSASFAGFSLSTKFRYVPAVAQAKKYIDEGMIGTIRSIAVSFSSKSDFSKSWYSNSEVSGGGVLFDNGTHAIDLINYFLNEIGVINVCVCEKPVVGDVEHIAHLELKFAQEVRGEITLSWCSSGAPHYLSIEGDKGSIHLGWRKSIMQVTDVSSVVEFGGYDKDVAFSLMLNDFARLINGQSSQMVSPLLAESYVDWLECAYQKTSYTFRQQDC